uniref:Receptor expression-enhancing protein n=1 Tax=Spongospora subterranea TaxID=70186 RepID=A0A0H5R4Z2_9EUKA|eukprot:CRZ08862.1 hypothetical protein [Spongospora subterranea]
MSIVNSATRQFDAVKADSISTFKSIDASLNKVDLLKKLEKKTTLKPVHVVAAASVAVFLFLLFGFGSSAVGNLVGFVYPLYASFTALKTPSGDDDTFWLTYWVVFSFFGVVESFMDMTLGWVPLFHLAKVTFLVWCFLPQTKGANLIFAGVIDPIMAHLPACCNGGVNLNVQRSTTSKEGKKAE